MIIWIIILLLFIGTLVAAYFGSRYWHWAHVTLVVLVFLAAVGYFVLAAEVLRINAVLRKQANQLEAQLAETKANIDALKRGTNNSQIIARLQGMEVKIPEEAESVPSIAELEHQLFLATRLRGPVWRKVAPAGFDPATNTVTVTVETPQPTGIAVDSILFLFEDGKPAHPDPNQGPQFLGEFRVTEAAGQQAKLVAVHELDELEKQRIGRSPGNWAMYEIMPIDHVEMFAGLKEAELRKLLPEQSVGEYLRQGTPAGPDDDEWHIAGYDADDNRVGPKDMAKAAKKFYQRRVHDYVTEFAQLHRERIVLLASIETVKKDNERLQSALASAKKLGEFRQEEIRKLTIDLAGVKKERAIIEKHLAQVQQQLATAERLLKAALAENLQLADELARREAERPQRSGSAAGATPLATSR